MGDNGFFKGFNLRKKKYMFQSLLLHFYICITRAKPTKINQIKISNVDKNYLKTDIKNNKHYRYYL